MNVGLESSHDVRESGLKPTFKMQRRLGVDQLPSRSKFCIASDIDGTIVHSRRSGPHDVVVERYDGREIGFVTSRAWRELAELQTHVELIPATARVARQYRRLRFPVQPRCAVVEAGARLLIDGELHAGWDATVRGIAARATASQEEVADRMAALNLAEPVRCGDVVLVCARLATGSAESDFSEWCTAHGWVVTRQSSRVYAMPAGVDKGCAVEFAVREVAGELIAAAGDGPIDESMLRLASFALTPVEGQLWSSGARLAAPVEGRSLDAAERIVARFLEYAKKRSSTTAINTEKRSTQ